MKKRFLALLLVCAMCFSLTGCLDEETASDNGAAEKQEKAGEKVEANPAEPEFEGDGTWTILVYLCGTDLESAQASGTDDMIEMLSADTGKNAHFIVQTGGASKWQNKQISADKIGRYEIMGKDIAQIDELDQANMGDGNTLKEFVNWGMENYGSGKLGLVLWDHGGGSVSGVCLDENYKGDTLTLMEIKDALSGIDHKFNFIGCDACLMSTVEMASMLAPYASYMIGSEETESGYGWDYKKIAKALKKNSKISTPDLGKVICDGFMASCKKSGEQDSTTLAITDLTKIDKVVKEFDKVAAKMNEKVSDVSALGNISKGIKKAESYGGNTPSEGYTNMVDLGDIAKKISSQVDTKALLAAIDDAVVYQVKGKSRSHANGLSVYYPLNVEDSKELETFEKVCVSDNYLNFIGAMIYGAENGSTENYSGENDWSSADSQSNQFQSDSQVQVTVTEDVHINEDDYYEFSVDPSSIDNIQSIQYNLYMDAGDGSTLYYLGSDNDVIQDDESGKVSENFRGVWPALPDGSLLTMYVVEEEDDYTIFSAPIYLNGEKTNLRFAYLYPEDEDNEDGEWFVLGAWAGIDEYGQAAKKMVDIEKGDEIIPIYIAVDAESGETDATTGDTYKVGKNFNVEEVKLPKGDYMANFSIIDVFGSTANLDFMSFKVNKKGDVETNN